MRPRPATWAALLVSAGPVSSPHSAAKCASHQPRSQRNARCCRTLQAPDRQILDSPMLTRNDCISGGVKSRFSEGPFEEAATPEFSGTRRSLFPKTLPPVHPREPPVTASSAAAASRLNASHVCTFSTLREREPGFKGKLAFRCEETVDDRTSLWKGKEKGEKIPAFAPLRRMDRQSHFSLTFASRVQTCLSSLSRSSKRLETFA